jgi:exocyst complex protein 7
VSKLKQHLKDTFSSFNAAVERIYNTQSGWTIPDAALRDAVRRVIKSDVLPPYQDFLRRRAGREGAVGAARAEATPLAAKP